MRVEIRKSDGPACESCGATEIVETKLGKPLVFDAGRLLMAERKKIEAELGRVYADKLAEIASAGEARAAAARTAIRELEAHHLDVRRIAAEGVQTLVSNELSRLRIIARRRQRKLIEQAEPVIAALLADTARV